MALVIKNQLVNAGEYRNTGSIPESGRSPRREYSPLQNPMDRRAWLASVHEVIKS